MTDDPCLGDALGVLVEQLKPSEIIADKRWNSRQAKPAPRSEDGKWPDEQLEESIRKNGLLEPLRVRKLGAAWFLVFGFRRYAACHRIDPNKPIPCMVMPSTGREGADDLKARYENIIENVERSDLSVPDRARAFWDLRRKHGASCTEIAEQTGYSESLITQLVRLQEGLSPALLSAWNQHPDRYAIRDLLKAAAHPPDEQVKAYNAAVSQRRGGRPKGSRTSPHVYVRDLADWRAEVAKLLKRRCNTKRQLDFLAGARLALAAVDGEGWDVREALRSRQT